MRTRLSLLLALLAGPAALALADGPGRLTIEDRRFHAGGQTVRLYGVAVGDPVLARADRPTDDYGILAGDWRANVVRMSIHPGAWRKDRDRALELLERDVKGARAAGLAVVITWHAIGWPDGNAQPSAWDPGVYDCDFSLAEDFWRAVADRFGDDGRVIFELWNEPTDLEPGDTIKLVKEPRGWTELKPYWRRLRDLIRERSPNVILATGGGWAYDLRGIKDDPLEGENIGYSWHVYAGHDKNDPAKWAEKLDDLDRSQLVFVTEWGFERGASAHYKGTPEEFAPFIEQFLDGRDLDNMAWVWHPTWGPNMLESDWRTPTEFGAYVREYLRRHNPPSK